VNTGACGVCGVGAELLKSHARQGMWVSATGKAFDSTGYTSFDPATLLCSLVQTIVSNMWPGVFVCVCRPCARP